MTHPFDKAREAAVRAMTATVGYQYETLYANKQEYIADRGARHDVNVPYKGDFDAGLDAALSALEAHGYVLVPVEPTEAMMEAIDAVNDAERARLQKSAHSVSQKSWRDTHIASHKAMLAAWKKESGK